MVDQFSCTKVYTISLIFLGIVPCDSLPWRICLTFWNHQTIPNKQIQTTLSPRNTNPSYPQNVQPFIRVFSCYFTPFITRLGTHLVCWGWPWSKRQEAAIKSCLDKVLGGSSHDLDTWLIAMLIVSVLRIGLWEPLQMAELHGV